MENKKTLLTGIKLGLQITAITMVFSPLIVYIHLYLLAVERGASPVGIYYELYCFGGPVIVLLWFSIPYLFGSIALAYITKCINSVITRTLGSAVIGMFAGIVGNWILIDNFLISSRTMLYESEWVLIGMMEFWSIAVFVWMENRKNYTTAISD